MSSIAKLPSQGWRFWVEMKFKIIVLSSVSITASTGTDSAYNWGHWWSIGSELWKVYVQATFPLTSIAIFSPAQSPNTWISAWTLTCLCTGEVVNVFYKLLFWVAQWVVRKWSSSWGVSLRCLFIVFYFISQYDL